MWQAVDFTPYGPDFCEIRLHNGVSPGCERIKGNPWEIGDMVLGRMEALGIPYDSPVYVEWVISPKSIGHHLGILDYEEVIGMFGDMSLSPISSNN